MKLKDSLALGALLFACQPALHLPPPTATVVATDLFTIPDSGLSDILFVIDDSGSMREEQQHIMKEIGRLAEILNRQGTSLRFATVTTNTRGASNQSGDFFIRPSNASGEPSVTRDIKDRDGVILDIPDEFCDEVLARSEGGVLHNFSPPLLGLLTENNTAGDIDPAQPGIQILDYMGRDPATTFIDADGDPLGRPERPSQEITATFADMVGCIAAVGAEGSSFEAGLCKAAAALDADSLAGDNAAFLRDPNGILAVIFIGDEDDCTLQITTGSTISCAAPDGDEDAIDEAASAFCTQPSSTTICDTGVSGVSEQLVPAQLLAQALLEVKIEQLLFIASLAGPPTSPSLECAPDPSITPSCEAGARAASPGNRYLLFTGEFADTLDSFSEAPQDTPGHLAQGICGAFGEALVDRLVPSSAALLNECRLQAPIADDFDVERDMRVTVDLSIPQKTCDQIVVDTSLFGVSGAPDGEFVLVPLNAEQTLCEVRRDPTDGVSFFQLDNITEAVCANGFHLSFVDFALPAFTQGKIEYISSPE